MAPRQSPTSGSEEEARVLVEEVRERRDHQEACHHRKLLRLEPEREEPASRPSQRRRRAPVEPVESPHRRPKEQLPSPERLADERRRRRPEPRPRQARRAQEPQEACEALVSSEEEPSWQPSWPAGPLCRLRRLGRPEEVLPLLSPWQPATAVERQRPIRGLEVRPVACPAP